MSVTTTGKVTKKKLSATQDSFTKLSRAFSTWLTPSLSVRETGFDVKESFRDSRGTVFLPAVHSIHGDQIQWSIFRRQVVATLPNVCAQFEVDLSKAQESITDMASQFRYVY